MPGASLIRRGVAVIGGGLPELAEAIWSRYAESVYVRYGGSLADIRRSPRHVRFTHHAAGSMHSCVSFLTLLTTRLDRGCGGVSGSLSADA
jgi:hypothetical protein